jgi:hypothetical protein
LRIILLMITFSLSKDSGIHCVSGAVSLAAFPSDGTKSDATITLLANPEEHPTEGVISWPGEYERGGVSLRGIGHKDGAQVSYSVEIDNTRCAFISSPLHDWTDHELELLGNIDVLVLPAGDVKLAQRLIDEIDPRVLIPLKDGDASHYAELLKISGAQGNEAEKEYKLKGLPAEGRVVVVLK